MLYDKFNTVPLYYGPVSDNRPSLISFDYIGLEAVFIIVFTRLIQFPQVVFVKRSNHLTLFIYKDRLSFQIRKKLIVSNISPVLESVFTGIYEKILEVIGLQGFAFIYQIF